MTADNLALWRTVERTDPKHVKEITGKTYKGNSPNPHYLIHRATETFGPIGIGWGFDIVSERIEEGAGGEKMHFARVKVWYEWNGKRGGAEHVGGTQFSGTRASGKPFTDEDAPKKSVTDALVKALSMIGFAGDIFMGRYDDSKYIAEVREEFAARKAQSEDSSPFVEETLAVEYLREGLKVIAGWDGNVVSLKAWWDSEAEYRAKADVKNGTVEYTELFTAFRDKGIALTGGTASPPAKNGTRASNPLRG